MSKVTTVGIDLAKSVFQFHGIDASGEVILRRQIRRVQMPQMLSQLAPCVVVMEACGGAHYWARLSRELGHTVKLLAPRYVKAFVRGAKNDRNDARAICEAGCQPGMPTVAVKSETQQGCLALHRVRALAKKQRTMVANQVRGLLAEQGIVLAKRIGTIRRELPGVLPRLEPHLRRALELQWQQLQALDRQIAVLDQELKELASGSATCQRLMRERGVGPVIATAITAEVPEPRVFRNGRHFAAFLGLVPGQDSTGGRAKLLGVTKRGDAYLRTQLVHGARSALRRAAHHDDELSRWAQALAQRRGFNRAVVALANKLARRLWAILRYGEAFRATAAA